MKNDNKRNVPGLISSVIAPVIVYYAAVLIVQAVGAVVLVYTVGENEITRYVLLLQTIGALIVLPVLYRMYVKDLKKNDEYIDKEPGSIPIMMWMLLIPVGVCASIGLNMIINSMDWVHYSESFLKASEYLFSGPLLVQYVGIILIIPVCEELIYRGLIYKRLKRSFSQSAAAGAAALIFALMHMNIVQGIYAFILAILFIYCMEIYGSLRASIILHISANAGAMALSALPDIKKSGLVTGGIVFLIIAFILLFYIDRKSKHF